MTSFYTKVISRIVPPDQHDPGEVEAMMRCYVGTLDSLTLDKFRSLALRAANELAGMTPADRQALAHSYGCHRRVPPAATGGNSE